MRTWISRIALAAAAIAGFVAAPAGATEGSKVKTSLTADASTPDARGKVKLKLKSTKGRFKVKVAGLASGASHTLLVGGVPQGTFTTSSSGSGKIGFSQPARPGENALDFDPRGQEIEVEGPGGTSATGVVSGAGEASDTVIDERTNLQPTALAPGGKAEARFRSKRGENTFKVEIEDVPAGTYDLYVGGTPRGQIVVDPVTGQGEIEFDSTPDTGDVLLDFDPRGETVDVVQGSDVFFSGPMEAQAGGVNVCTFAEVELPLTSTGVDPDASGKARLRVRDDCDRDFRVEIEDVPLGAYDLLVGGVFRGIITVIDTGTEIEGDIEFDTDPDDPDEVLLDFDPAGALIEVVQGATTFFSSTFDGDPGAGGGGSTCVPEETILPVASTGVDPDGNGEARFRVRDDCDEDFQVQIEDVPLGDYDLLVGGVLRGTITVVDTGSGIEGQIEFDTDVDQPGELPLTFDPRGQTIDVVQGATVFFSDTFGAGGGGGGSTCTPTETEVPLLNVGPIGSAKGKARFRTQDDCDTDFRVEIEDLPLGTYDLVVAGAVRGTIDVVDTGIEVEGQIEFDSDPDEPGEVLLTFDPQGALVEIVQGGTVFLERSFPTT